MVTGWNNKRVGQMGEFLFCAEVARRCECIATPFAGNVPIFDVLVTDHHCNTVPVQVKTAQGGAWQMDGAKFLDIEKDEASQRQIVRGPRSIEHLNLLLAFVWIGPDLEHHRFFILTRRDLQHLVLVDQTNWLAKHDGHRPRNWESTHCALRLKDLEPFENQWELILQRLASINQSAG